jgi:alpha-L-arabinofuranosidase
MTVLRSDKLDAVNSLENPKAIHPVDKEVKVKGNKLNLTFAPYSVNVIRVKK